MDTRVCPFIFVMVGTSPFPEAPLASQPVGVLQCKVVPSAQLLLHSIGGSSMGCSCYPNR